MEEDEALYKTHFSSYIAADFGPDDMEEKMAAVHEAIRADPSPSKKYVKFCFVVCVMNLKLMLLLLYVKGSVIITNVCLFHSLFF